MTATTNPEGAFTSRDGLRLFRQAWAPMGPHRAGIVLVHGYAEHSERYAWFGTRMAEAGFAVHAYDLRGHGFSEGPRVLVRSFKEHLDDLSDYLDLVRLESPATPLFLFGHSMGGCIATLYAVTRKPELAGLILSGPAIRAPGRGPRVMAKGVGAVARIAPGLGVRKLTAGAVSRDPEVVERYEDDPQVYHGKMPAGTIAAISRAIARIDRDMEAVTQPLLIVHGTSDALCDPAGSEALYARAASADKTLKLYDGLYHEVLNEPERDTVLADIMAWVDARS